MVPGLRFAGREQAQFPKDTGPRGRLRGPPADRAAPSLLPGTAQIRHPGREPRQRDRRGRRKAQALVPADPEAGSPGGGVWPGLRWHPDLPLSCSPRSLVKGQPHLEACLGVSPNPPLSPDAPAHSYPARRLCPQYGTSPGSWLPRFSPSLCGNRIEHRNVEAEGAGTKQFFFR